MKIFGLTFEKPKGDVKLGYMARTIRGMIKGYGVNVVRKQVIKIIEGDMKRCLSKENPVAEIDKMITNAMNTPDYVKLLEDLNMNERHLRYLATEALNAKRISK